MRAGGSTVIQQSLTPEASAIVKQAMSLARRRGHAQVTPLHVTTTMLSVPTGLLRAACIRSHSQSHPLRCKALDLCFNVALNRLPSSSQISMGPYRAHHQPPSLSNSLVATFKRAQAHQRRGSAADAQQQAMLAVRIDVEQLIISILDDPSVSRVMREAGFLSTQVKVNVEKAVSSEMAAPSVSLDLSLNYDSNLCSQLRSKRSNEDNRCWPLLDDGIRNELSTPSSVVSPNTTNSDHRASVLPPWLLQHRQESRRATIIDLVSLHAKDHCKWNSILNPDSSEKPLDFSSVSPSTSSHNPNSTSSIETKGVEYLPKFKEVNAENLKALCNSLERISCQKGIIPKIASTILQCRSGMVKRKERSGSPGIKEETWLFFLGTDTEGKEKIARGLATLIFGSHSNFISIELSEYSSCSDLGSKRSRLEGGHGYLARLAGAIQDNPHRVFLLENVEQLDYDSQISILNATRSGMMKSTTDENVRVSDAIIILSCENFDSRSKACSPPVKQKFNSYQEKEDAGFDLNLHVECGDVDRSFDDVGLLEAVDSTFLFKCPDEL